MIMSRRTIWAVHIARTVEKSNIILVGRPERKRPLDRPRNKCENDIKVDFIEIGCGVMDWIDLAEVRDLWKAVVNTVMNL
jgi:hypothetical protein